MRFSCFSEEIQKLPRLLKIMLVDIDPQADQTYLRPSLGRARHDRPATLNAPGDNLTRPHCDRYPQISSSGFGVFAEDVEEGRGGGREIYPATVGGPEGAIVSKSAHRHSHQNTALQLFTHAHSRHER